MALANVSASVLGILDLVTHGLVIKHGAHFDEMLWQEIETSIILGFFFFKVLLGCPITRQRARGWSAVTDWGAGGGSLR